jgi:predicted dehydrogenase
MMTAFVPPDRPIRWGILSTGSIAAQFAEGLRWAADAELHAVASRTQETADRFGDRFGIARRYSSYEALAADPEVDVVYIGTPHPRHRDDALLCIDAGKAVLLEKPFTLNAADTATVIARARSRGVFLMEAMWTRFTPVMQQVRALLDEGALGPLRFVSADFGFRAPFDAASRLYAPELGGGALLDVGIYPVSFASFVFREQPHAVQSFAEIGQTGVDEQNTVNFQYANGALAQLSSAVATEMPHEAMIVGERGSIRIPRHFWNPRRFTLTQDGKTETVEPEYRGNGYNYEAEAVCACLRAGVLESAVMPLDETHAIMQTMDRIRAPWGLVYPAERGQA